MGVVEILFKIPWKKIGSFIFGILTIISLITQITADFKTLSGKQEDIKKTLPQEDSAHRQKAPLSPITGYAVQEQQSIEEEYTNRSNIGAPITKKFDSGIVRINESRNHEFDVDGQKVIIGLPYVERLSYPRAAEATITSSAPLIELRRKTVGNKIPQYNVVVGTTKINVSNRILVLSIEHINSTEYYIDVKIFE